jgi:hypothetical protein
MRWMRYRDAGRAGIRSALKIPTILRSRRIIHRNCSIDSPPPFCESAFPRVVMEKKSFPGGRSTSQPVVSRSMPLCSRTNLRRSCGNLPVRMHARTRVKGARFTVRACSVAWSIGCIASITRFAVRISHVLTCICHALVSQRHSKRCLPSTVHPIPTGSGSLRISPI